MYNTLSKSLKLSLQTLFLKVSVTVEYMGSSALTQRKNTYLGKLLNRKEAFRLNKLNLIYIMLS